MNAHRCPGRGLRPKAAVPLLALFLAGCLTIPDDVQPPAWTADWLLPLAYGDFALEDLEPLARFRFDAFASAADLGLAFTAPGQERPRATLGPYPVEWDETVRYAETAAVVFDVRLDNTLPADFFTTCTLRVADAVTGADVIVLPVALALPADGSYTTEIRAEDVALGSAVELFVDELDGILLPGGSPEPGEGVRLDVEARLEGIARIDLAAGRDLSLADTTDISLELPDTEGDADWDGSGTLTLALTNGLPLGATLDLAFLDAGGAIVDLLSAGEPVLDVPGLAPDGTVSAPATRELTYALDRQRLERLGDAERLAYRFSAYTPAAPDPVSARSGDGLSLRATLRLNTRIQP